MTLLLATGCSDQNPSSPRPSTSTEPLFAKASASPTVTSAAPSYAYQGTTNLDVTINGSGFDRGTKASWYLNGAPYLKITVNSTSYVSPSQLVANISVASDAQIDAYDIVVTTSTTKQGIGSDCFVVTLAVPVPVVGRGINMAGQVVGDLANSSTNSGNLWDPGVGTVSLPNAYKVWGIDETGSTISGKDNNGVPAIWTSSNGAGGPWTEIPLPVPAGVTTGSARSLASDANGNAVFIAGAHLASTGLDSGLVWTRTIGGWQVRRATLPSGVPGGWPQSINAKGQSAGMNGAGGSYALYWDSLGTSTILSSNKATAWSINGDGTVVVGSANGVAAMWVRTLSNGVYGPWSGDIFLDTPANSCGNPNSTAYAVNAAGTVAVGTSCNQPVAWNISGTAVSRFLLGTLGPPNNGTAFSINNLPQPNAGGGVSSAQNGSTFTSGVVWKSF
jgi:uncharacterized membrane protein